MDNGIDWSMNSWVVNERSFPASSSICEEFLTIANRTPDAVAVETRHPDGSAAASLTYAQLDGLSSILARRLIADGIAPGARIALATRRDADVVIGMLAILKTGSAYVPLDLAYPADRLSFMLEDAGIDTLLVSDGLSLDFDRGARKVVTIDDHPDEAGTDPLPAIAAGDAAYVVYTSGSTGTPKGVVTPHRAVLRLTRGSTFTPLGPDRRILQMSSVAFDAATFEIWGALLNGGTCIVYPGRGLPDLSVLKTVLRDARINTLWLTSSLFNAVIDVDALILGGVEELLVGGEALSVHHVRKAQGAIGANLVNGYGPTETTTFACTYRIPRPLADYETAIPIGGPIENTAISIRDANGAPVARGERGELFIAGAGLADGYLGRPELTAERFVSLGGAPGGRAYRTGDMVRMRSDGAIAFEGRNDGQVKVSGHRIELSEIEQCLVAHPQVRSAAAAVHRVDGVPDRIAAWVVAPDGAPTQTELRAFVAERLPSHMVPSIFTTLDTLPLTASGKLDRAALLVPVRSRPVLAQPFAAPRGEVERFVAEIWAEMIGVDQVGRHDRFFEIGGTSLMAMRLIEAFRRERGHRIGVAAFFDAATPANVARLIEDGSAAAPRAQAAQGKATGTDQIAIVGIAGRFAGAADVDAFWRMLKDGRSGRVEVTRDDMIAAGQDPTLLDDPDYVAAAYPLDDVEGFDAAFFGMTPREVQIMDPQQRVFLEAAWSALEDAAIDPRQGTDLIGVFGGVGRNAYMLNNLMSHPELRDAAGEYNMLVGNERDFPSTHVAFRLGLRGPAITVQSACSTSGVAIHMAAESLRRGECDVALAGGAKVLVPNRAGYRYTEGGPLSPDGHIRAFDARAGGMVRGSGVAMVALKRLDDALTDGNHIYSVLIGSSINNDGRNRAGFTAPSARGQAEVIAQAHRNAGIDAGSVSLIEAHGTGTPLGDPIEVTALIRAFRETTQADGFCAIGSVKTNIGHLDAGATAAGLIKASLALKHGVIPPSLNFETPNPGLGIEGSPFRVASVATPWPRGSAARRAGVSSFGLGGTNAHLVIEEAPAEMTRADVGSPQLLVVSARTEAALSRRCDDLATRLEAADAPALNDAAHTLRIGRHRFEQRFAIVARDRADAVAKLRARAPADAIRTAQSVEDAPVAFMFPGGGAQYAGMARGLYDDVPTFRATIDACAAHHDRHTGRSLHDMLFGDGAKIERPTHALPTLLAVELAMGRLWLDWGVEPVMMIGHSMGEYAAAALAGVFSEHEAMDIVLARGRLFETLAPGGMLSVPRSVGDVRPMLEEALSIAAINRPDQCVVSGPHDALDRLAGEMAERGIETRRIHIDVAAHSTMVEPILDPFRAELAKVAFHAPTRAFVSNVTGAAIRDEEATDPEYWVRHLRQTVLFSDGLKTVFEDPDTVLLECGPGQTLSTFARQHPDRGTSRDVIASIRHPHEASDDAAVLLGAVGRLWRAGVRLDWHAYDDGRSRRVSLPGYPFERVRHWIDAVPIAVPQETASETTTDAAPELELPVEVEPTAAPVSRFERILIELRAIVARLSGLPAEEIDIHATFLELGFDSLFLTQANAAFKKAFRLPLTTRQLMESTPRLQALAEHIDAALDADATIGSAVTSRPGTTARSIIAAATSSAVAGTRPAESPGIATVRRGASDALSPEQEAHIDALIASTIARTPLAKAGTQASRAVLADPRTVQGFRSRWKEMVYPILSDRTKGAHVWDLDGNRYVDLVGGYGVSFLGHQHPVVVDAIRDQVDRSLAIGPQTTLAAEVADLVSDMTGMARVAFCNTGSEAVLAAVRMARTATGRSKIAKFDGHYHGIFDEMQVRGSGAGSRKTTLPAAPGIPAEAVVNTVVLDYGNDDAFDVIRENAADLALVLVEPVRSRNPDYQPKEYLQRLRALTEELDIPLLFDEIVTGFRCHPGGAQAWFDVRADIATYGKVAGGGLPLGIVAGSPRFMDTLDGGTWSFGDESVPTSDMTWFAGTFVRHPLSLAATRATLRHLKAEGPALQAGLNARSAAFAADLNALFRRFDVRMKMEHFSSVLRLTFTQHQEHADLLFFHLRNRGVMTYEGRPIFLTTAHDDADYALVLAAFEESLRALLAVGLLDGRDPDVVRRIPMATGQQEIWVSARFSEQASCSYNLCSTLRLKGAFDPDRFKTALQALAHRHEALRALPDRDGLMQRICAAIDVPLTLNDLASFDDVASAAMVERLKTAEVRTPFDLDHGPLVRASLISLDADDHLILFTVHHVIADGWSCGVLCRELGELYAGRGDALPEAMQLSAFVAMQDDPETREAREEARAYWTGLYPSGLPRIEFPLDRPRPPRRDYAAHRIEIQLDDGMVARLRQVARDNGTTLFAALIGGFAAYIGRLTGATDHPVGFAAAGQVLMDGQALVGHCVNFLPLRLSTDLSDDFGTHLRHTGGAVLDALEHQNFDFLSFVQETQPQRDADWAPLVTIGVNLDPSAKAMRFANLDVEAGSVGRAFENLDIFLNFVETELSVELQCTFSTALFDTDTIRVRMGDYLRFLDDAATRPGESLGDIHLLDPEDRTRMLGAAGPNVETGGWDGSVVARFRKTTDAAPDDVALRDAASGAGTTYAALDMLSDAWADRLAAAGVRAGDRVIVSMERSSELVVAILAILKAGAAYVPLDVDLPDARLRLVMEDCGATVCLTGSDMSRSNLPDGTTSLCIDLDAALPKARTRRPEPAGDDLAYIMYTSGSTGTPKGVMVAHRAIVRLAVDGGFARLDTSRTLACLAPPFFDASTFEIWGALLNGATLQIVPGVSVPELRDLRMLLRGTTTLWLTAGLFNVVVDEDPTVLDGVEELLVGGEALSASHVARAQAAHPDLQIINGYGPTENTTFTCCYRIPRDLDPAMGTVPIGYPIGRTRVYVVDDAMRLLPPGVPGELVTGGDGLALGYWNRKDLTAKSFVPDTISGISGARLYRTGDVCRMRLGGAIEFIRRADDQMKIRGFRVEPIEIEAALETIDGIGRAAVIVRGGAGNGRLVAFVVPVGSLPETATILAALRLTLPRHLMPAEIHALDVLPITANGKLDRKALAARVAIAPMPDTTVPPATPTETALTEIWTDILGKPVPSVEESFFDLGGHSLNALRLFDRIAHRFDADLPMSSLFSAPTVRDLAALVDIARAEKKPRMVDLSATPWDTSVILHSGPHGGAERPVFIVGGLGGNVNHLIELGAAIGRHRPAIGFQARGILGHRPHDSIETMAADNIGWMRKHQSRGPYILAGYSAGAFVAFEMARQLRAAGEGVRKLLILDTYAPGFATGIDARTGKTGLAHTEVWDRIVSEVPQMFGLGRRFFWQRAEGILVRKLARGWVLRRLERISPTFVRIRRTTEAWFEAAGRYGGGPYDGEAQLVLSTSPLPHERRIVAAYLDVGWSAHIDRARLTVTTMDGDHLQMVQGERALRLADLIEAHPDTDLATAAE